MQSKAGQIIKLSQKQEDKGLNIGDYGLPDIDIILQIREETNKQREYNTQILNSNYSPSNVSARRKKDNRLFSTSLSVHEKKYMYPTDNIKITWKSSPVIYAIY